MKKIMLFTCIFTTLLSSICFATIPLAEMTVNGIGIESTKQEVRKTLGLPSHSVIEGERLTDRYFYDNAPSVNSMTKNELIKYQVSRTKWCFTYYNDRVSRISISNKSNIKLTTKAGIELGDNEMALNVYGSADEVSPAPHYDATFYKYIATENPKITMTFACDMYSGKIFSILIFKEK